jgi:hypothetical protein
VAKPIIRIDLYEKIELVEANVSDFLIPFANRESNKSNNIRYETKPTAREAVIAWPEE